MARRKKRRATCLTCDSEAVTRGLCRTCYSAARYAIRTEKATERELIDAGFLLPAHAKPKGEFSAELAKWLASGNRRAKGCHGDRRQLA